MSRAALVLHEATGEQSYLDRARDWVAVALKHYWDGRGGFFFTADDAEALIARSKNALDQPNPSGNGTLAAVLARLYYLTGDDSHRARAQATLDAFAGEARRNIFGHGTLLNAAELLQRGLQIVVIGARAGADTAALLRVIHGASLPNKILSVIAPGQALPSSHPAAGKEQVARRATVYVCEGPVCSLPLADPAALAAALASRR